MRRMNAKTLRARADPCRELLRVAVRDDVREQLREWANEFDDEADALESVRKMSSRYRNCFGAKQRASGAGLTMLGQCLAPAP